MDALTLAADLLDTEYDRAEQATHYLTCNWSVLMGSCWRV